MKRELLVEMNLQPEQINTIMAEYGKSVTTLKKEVASYQTEITSLKNAHDSLKQETEENFLKEQKNFAIKQSLKHSNVFDEELVASLLNSDKITIENNEVNGLSEQLDTMKKEKSFLFKPEASAPETTFRGCAPGVGIERTGEGNPGEAFSSISKKYKK